MKPTPLPPEPKENYICAKVGYLCRTGLTSAFGAGIGYLGKQGLILFGSALDLFNNKLIPGAAAADQHIGKVIVEQGGPVGEAIIKVDKAQGDFWSRAFGRSEEDQAQWRKEHGLESPSYIKIPDTKVTIEVPPLPTITPTSYEAEYAQKGDGLIGMGLLAGFVYGALTGIGKYRRAKRECDFDTATKRLNTVIPSLESRIQTLEQKNEQPGGTH